MANGILAKNGAACTLFSKLQYEYEIELLTLGAAPFYNQRRLPVLLGGGSFDAPNGTKLRYVQGLLPGTPREMPVPHAELTLKVARTTADLAAKPAVAATPGAEALRYRPMVERR